MSNFWPTGRWRYVCAGLLSATAVSGCGSTIDGVGAPSFAVFSAVSSYKSANAFDTTGHSERELGADHYLVRATGSAATPPDRVEKIAIARAAELGAELKFKAFRASPGLHTVSCTPAKPKTHKTEAVAAASRPVVEIDVVYIKEPTDPTFAETAAAQRLIDALATDLPTSDAQAAAVAAAKAGCAK
jgi:hypothetical protein